ncbi:vWA domain-containing protein [Aestuariibaculum sediminum]|uniref:VWA domain-containing protein n=1 Tax=Aestuariibaculum sediminum TaxID=2770637 RepID=A0A8J6QFQ4_9FLAO|nr:vWA domain-containing protein [Aestuariibaculum sediminum]MBD0831309.1 VWA domain-containing protein [Aestuariibaculum sediminum]
MFKIILSILLILCHFIGLGQNFKKEQRIYMLDITKSMWGLNDSENIFNEVKNTLYKGIEDIKDPETIVKIIPFQATYTYLKLDRWTFKAGDRDSFLQAKKTIDNYSIENVPGGYTDIYSALETAKKNIDSDRVNYIFLLTDGNQSPIPSASKKTSKIDFSEDDLKTSLGNWCDFSNKSESHLFYVMLSKAALNKPIVNIIEKQCNAYSVEGTNMNIAFIKPYSNNIKVNLHDDPNNFEIELNANNWDYIKGQTFLKINLKNNSIFEVDENNIKVENNKIVVRLKTKNNETFEALRKNSPIESVIPLTLSTDNNLKILNPDINLVVRNNKERVLTLEFVENE